ncbi:MULTISPECIES: arginine deiminase-related protein [Pseudoxanthomonas]|uniref:Amidinotransferase n=1 Tax=Pseudoxanthomonas winnipegensis TaxID=2480810 RepID=A0A4Q8LD46_9GAMM|nr:MULTISPECIES: arginine deiminase-related protein [Pseudoxanthomonas]TAA26586.1 amidinotransferase [Pseudoxanthomonas winnipegensis]TMN24542.1 amidinotransferase [Pseudoxanthomonas sp. X-1]UAY75189.1 amidinotransferase [Pseudoxanthomonas sp. X-1]
MITRDPQAFLALARTLGPDWGAATARGVFLVSPDGFARAEESARDNAYMANHGFDAAAALAEHRALHQALSAQRPVVAFAGDAATPDALFPNNVFATVPGRAIVGRMRHPVRQREAAREDIRAFFTDVLGYALEDLSTQPHPCELTGSLVVDRARGLAICGLSERCDAQGAALMHAAFGLRATLLVELAPGEYHTNVVLALLAGRAALVSGGGFAQPEPLLEVLQALYGSGVIALDAAEQRAFAGNAISLTSDSVWMSRTAHRALRPATLAGLEAAGLRPHSVPLAAIEAAGGSLRCCVGEIF